MTRASADTGVPRTTIAEFRRQWKDGLPADIARAVRAVQEDFVHRMELARSLAMDRLTEIIPNITNAQQAATVIGILDDKIARARNVRVPDEKATPASLEEVQGQVGDWLLEAVEKAARRRVDTVESTATEQADTPALVAASQGDE